MPSGSLVRGTTQFLSEDATMAYLRTNDNLIVAVNKKTGEQKFKSKRQDLQLFATSEKPDGIVYAATLNGDVYAIRPALKAGSVGELVQLRLMPAGQALGIRGERAASSGPARSSELATLLEGLVVGTGLGPAKQRQR